MPISKNPNDWWQAILAFLRFAARMPLAILIAALTLTGAVLFGMTVFRAAEWFWGQVLAQPW